ncbi:hypothetical protein ACFP65_05740 [Marinilactibacillus sp. GCM10026970]|uniref:hypothetical protein n=1 Tax=Marinilactibacillus sp. GCM10026970 TaxID=3252642 RepID=UPI00360601B8
MNELEPLVNIPDKVYKYIVEGENALITLTVDNIDVFHNADGNIDCPLETVLRKITLL